MQAALESSVVPPSHKLVLVGLAAHAGWQDQIAWPSVRTLAGYAGTHRATVHRALTALQDAGLIEPVGTRSRGVVAYHLNLSHQRDTSSAQRVAPARHVDDDDVSHERDMSHDATVAPVQPQVSHQRDKGVAPVQQTCRTDATQTLKNTQEHQGNATAVRAGEPAGERAQARPREAAPPVPPSSGEDVDTLLSWVAQLADYYGGRLSEALTADARQRQAALRTMLEGEQPAVRVELARWLAAQASSWRARSIALAIGKPGVIQRARRDAATPPTVASSTVVYSERADGDIEIARKLLDLPLDSGLIELWVAPLSIASIAADLVVLAGPAHVVSWCQRMAPLIAEAVAAPIRLVHADTSALPTVADLAGAEVAA